MSRLPSPASAMERSLRLALALAESRLALLSLVLLVVAVIAASIWWDSLDDLRNLILILAAVIGFPFLTWRARVADRQAAAAEKALLDTRFDRAVEMVESPLLAVREAGRFRIAELGERYPEDYGQQARLLLRDHSRETEARDDNS